MKNLYQAIVEKIKTDIPELKWADLDKGQMNYERPPISFPAALINIQLPKCDDLNTKKQLVDANIIIRLCFDFTGNTSGVTPKMERDKSLAYFDILEKVYKTFQGFGTAEFNELSRINVFEEQRPDAYKVVGIVFKTAYQDFTAAI